MINFPISPKNVSYEATREKMNNSPNFQLLGSGICAKVYAWKDTNIVVKLCHNREDGYLKYISQVGLNSKNPYLPKILFVQRYESFYLVGMEKLVPYYKFERHSDASLKKLSASSVIEFGMKAWVRSNKRNKNPNVKEVASIMDNLFFTHKSRTYCPDFHEGNIMWRVSGNTKTLVITDPAV